MIANNDDLVKALSKLSQRFDRIISLREPFDKAAAQYINQAIHGGVDSKTQSMAQQFVNVGEGKFAGNWRELTAMDMAFFDEDWFKLEESPDGTSEQILMDILADYLRNCLQKPFSGFFKAMLFAKLQSKLLGIGAIAYNFCCKKQKIYKRRFDRKATQLLRGEEASEKIIYQGPKFEFLDIRNTYLDTLSPVALDINSKDVYYRYAVHVEDLLDDETYQKDAHYPYDDFCFYRDNDGVDKLKDAKPTYTLGILERETKYKQNQVTHYENHVEVRSAWLKRFKVGDETFKDVEVTWVHCDSAPPIPLKIEENRFSIYRNWRVFTEWQNIFDDYGKTQLGFNYNASEWSNFLRSAQALGVIQSMFGGRLVPEEFIASISEATGKPREEIDKYFESHPDTLGKIFTYQASALNQMALSPENAVINLSRKDYLEIFTLLQAERAQTQSEMSSNVIDLGNVDVADSTAKGVQYVQSKQANLAKLNLKELADNVLVPVLNMAIEDMSSMFTNEQYSYGLSENEKEKLEELNPDLQFVKARMGQGVIRDFEQAIQLGQDAGKFLKTSVNTQTGQLVVELTPEAWACFAGQIRVMIENNQYSLAEQERWADKLTQLTATLPEALAGLKEKLTTDLAIQYLELGKFPSRRDYDKFVAQIEQMDTSAIQQAQKQQELARMSAETNKINAEAAKADAEGKEEASRAMKQMQEVEKAETIKQIAELQSGAL